MIKSNLDAYKFNEFKPIHFFLHSITTHDVISETKEFLNYYYKGAYNDSVTAVNFKSVTFSPTGFAYILRIIFKAVYGRDLITVKDEITDGDLIFKIEFDTKYLSEENITEMKETAKESQISLEFYPDSVNIRMRTYEKYVLTVHSIAPKKVLRALSNIFFLYY